MALSVEFIYLVARWLGSGKISMALSVESIYLVARLAQQWKKIQWR